MLRRHLILEKNEYLWLSGLIQSQRFTDPLDQACINTLQREMKYAIVKDEDDMPDHIVRLNSMVSVDTPYGHKTGLQLVAPSERDINQDKISILSPMGSALIGYGRGDEVNWIFPKGKGKIRITEVQNVQKGIMS